MSYPDPVATGTKTLLAPANLKGFAWDEYWDDNNGRWEVARLNTESAHQIFDDDRAAWEFVKRLASEGDEICQGVVIRVLTGYNLQDLVEGLSEMYETEQSEKGGEELLLPSQQSKGDIT